MLAATRGAGDTEVCQVVQSEGKVSPIWIQFMDQMSLKASTAVSKKTHLLRIPHSLDRLAFYIAGFEVAIERDVGGEDGCLFPFYCVVQCGRDHYMAIRVEKSGIYVNGRKMILRSLSVQ